MGSIICNGDHFPPKYNSLAIQFRCRGSKREPLVPVSLLSSFCCQRSERWENRPHAEVFIAFVCVFFDVIGLLFRSPLYAPRDVFLTWMMNLLTSWHPNQIATHGRELKTSQLCCWAAHKHWDFHLRPRWPGAARGEKFFGDGTWDLTLSACLMPFPACTTWEKVYRVNWAYIPSSFKRGSTLGSHHFIFEQPF